MRASHASLVTKAQAAAAINMRGTPVQSAAGATTITSNTCAAGNMLICFAFYNHQVTSAAPSGWVKAVASESGTNYGSCGIYYLLNTAAQTYTFTPATNTGLRYLYMSEWSGLTTNASPLDGTGTTLGTSQVTSKVITSAATNNNGLIVSGISMSIGVTAGSGFTLIGTVSTDAANSNYQSAVEYQIQTTSGAQTVTFGGTAQGGQSMAAAIFKIGP